MKFSYFFGRQISVFNQLDGLQTDVSIYPILWTPVLWPVMIHKLTNYG